MIAEGARVGIGFDVHRFSEERALRICGVEIPDVPGLEGTSDGDVGLHAVIDALLGAATLGDIGELFPSSEPRWRGADSRDLTAITMVKFARAGFIVRNVDVTIVSQTVPIFPHRDHMREVVAGLLGLAVGAVSVKATSVDGLGVIGRGEGLAAIAAVTVEHSAQE